MRRNRIGRLKRKGIGPIMFKVGQIFKMKSKLDRDFRLFQYLGQDGSYFDPFSNHKIVEVETGEISHVEPEWFNQREIKLMD